MFRIVGATFRLVDFFGDDRNRLRFFQVKIFSIESSYAIKNGRFIHITIRDI